jgi:hypothetical protein
MFRELAVAVKEKKEREPQKTYETVVVLLK